jgi:nucleotide-binding universal stress UspA family protein
MYSAVLVALDGSQSAAAAIPPALELAQALMTRLVLLKVLPALEAIDGPARRDDQSRRFQAEGYLDSLKRSLQTRGVRIECLVRRGEPASVILETAEALGNALLVITTHGMAPPDPDGEAGRVAREVLRRADGPVFVVRPPRDLPYRLLSESAV